MSHFYAEILGNRGGASRTGTKESGMYAHIRGWHLGIKVVLVHEDGRDVIRAYRTGGSSGVPPKDAFLGEWVDEGR